MTSTLSEQKSPSAGLTVFLHAALFGASVLIPCFWIYLIVAFDLPVDQIEAVCRLHVAVVGLSVLSAFVLAVSPARRWLRVSGWSLLAAAVLLFLVTLYWDIRVGADIARDLAHSSYDT